MKRFRIALCALALAAFCGACARAQVVADGAVEYGRTVTQLAAMGGEVSDVAVSAGEYVRAGDVVATLSLTRAYAPCDGTVETIFADAGESADDAGDKYGGVLTILPESRYVVYTTAENAYKSVRTGRVASGQTVYLKCTRDGSHRGTGVVTEIDGDIFTVEVDGGSFYNGETVYAYMEDDYDAADRVGKGTVVASAVESVSAGGDVARLYVSEGDFVEKGQLLFETIGALPDGGPSDGEYALTAASEGYVAAVHAEANAGIDRDAPLLELCPADALVVTARVPEADVAAIAEGDAAAVSFELPEERLRLSGTVERISYLPESGADGETVYAVTVRFDADARVVPGMSATVSIG